MCSLLTTNKAKSTSYDLNRGNGRNWGEIHYAGAWYLVWKPYFCFFWVDLRRYLDEFLTGKKTESNLKIRTNTLKMECARFLQGYEISNPCLFSLRACFERKKALEMLKPCKNHVHAVVLILFTLYVLRPVSCKNCVIYRSNNNKIVFSTESWRQYFCSNGIIIHHSLHQK